MAAASPQAPISLLLDTNILIVYARQGSPADKLEAMLHLQAGAAEALISVVTVGEAFAFARKRGWGQPKQDALRELMRTKLIPVDINRPEILAAYAEIDHYCEKTCMPARPMGQNDMWIAATARVLQSELVTMDKDFDHLHDILIRRRWIDPTSLRDS